MSVALPDICPSSRQLTLGEFSTQRFRTQSGAVVVRLYGDKAYDYQLQLGYGGAGGLVDADTARFYAAWKLAVGHTTPVTLPPSVWGGADATIPQAIPGYITWFFTEAPPQITTTLPGYSQIQITLRGRLLG